MTSGSDKVGQQDQPAAANPEIVRYFAARTARLSISRTTHTASGQIIDWVPAASQHPSGAIATPPPATAIPETVGKVLPAGVRAVAEAATFELEAESAERGPPGTVPVARKDFTRIHTQTSLEHYLAKGPGKVRAAGSVRAPTLRPAAPDADPDPAGYFHAQIFDGRTAFGCSTVLNVYDPSLQNSGDHSIMQLGLINTKDQPQQQTLEAGWEVSNDQYGDYDPHLFVYYTTNDYTKDDDNLGGYNQEVDGWIQYSTTIYPAARIVGVSQRGGDQTTISIKVELYNANWWVQVNGSWIGYYPAALYMGNQSVFATLGDHADNTGFWGEVYSADDDPNVTTTQMGSGAFGEAGWGQACYQSNLLIQTDRGGTMSDVTGSGTGENTAYYDIVPTMQSGTAWGSYFYAGGPGAAIRWDALGGQWPGNPVVAQNADGRLEIFMRGNDSNLYHLWQTAPSNGWSAPWQPLGGQWKHDPVVARNADGRLEIFIVGNDSNLYHLWQTSPGGNWSAPWQPMGGQWQHQPVVATNADGRLEIFIIGNDSNLYHIWQTAPSNGWSGPWQPLGGQWDHDPVVARNADGRLEVFIIGRDSNLYHLWQTVPGGSWSAPWQPMGGQWQHQPVVATNADGRLEVFIIGNDTNLYHLWQTAPSNGWSAPWQPLGGQWKIDPCLARNADGRLEIFIPGNRPYLYHRWQTAPSNGWSSDWIAMPGSWHRPAVVANNQDGRLEIFIVGDDTNLYHAWQTAPSNGWALR